MPEIEIIPMVDDDLIEVRNGEFVVESVESATMSRFLDAIELARRYFDGQLFDRPTMFSLPSTDLCHAFARGCEAIGIPVRPVSSHTTRTERRDIFNEVVARRCALAQINVVSEGVDLPLRRSVDLAPVFSPVMFLQRFGRITRPVGPGEERPIYVCTNRNFLRHAYLLDGCVPTTTIVEAQKAFNGPSSRNASRVLGMEAIGRFKAQSLPLANGLEGQVYCMSAVQGNIVTDYAALIHPAKFDPIWAVRKSAKNPDGTRDWGKWFRCDPPEGLSGFASIAPNPVSDKQKKWWKTSAKRFGLDPNADVSRKNFVALPILNDLREYSFR